MGWLWLGVWGGGCLWLWVFVVWVFRSGSRYDDGGFPGSEVDLCFHPIPKILVQFFQRTFASNLVFTVSSIMGDQPAPVVEIWEALVLQNFAPNDRSLGPYLANPVQRFSDINTNSNS